ncbi:hypothetical protein ACR9YC_07315 [Parasphingorhabdus sp. DH2-15]|uniref:hypothetical protein n=1 Tax=Parasphingorhabdus sp. DH2-15 TaxID=3444112 RepID=UPI003F687512
MRTRFLYSLTLGLAVSGFAMTSVLLPVDAAFAQKKKEKKKKKKDEQPQEQLSPEFITPYNAALAALGTKDAATSEAQLSQAALVANTKDEKFRLGNAYVQLGGMKSDVSIQRKGVDLMLESGAVSQADMPRLSSASGRFAYSEGDYALAESRFKAAIDGGYYENNTELLYVDSVFQQGRVDEGLQLLNATIQRFQQSGALAPEDYYRRGVRRAYNAKNVQATTAWTQKWVAAYPNNTSWRDSLILFRDAAGFDSKTNIDLMRLMRATNSLASERDYAEYVENADPRRLPGEVLNIIEEGIAKGTLKSGDDFFDEQLGIAKSRVSEDRSSLTSGGASSRSSSNPRIAIGTADAYLGYGEYAEAIALYNVALEKPGVDSDLVNTRIGISNAMAGNWDAAKAAFAKVGGARTELAKFWLIWVDNQVAASEATPAAG